MQKVKLLRGAGLWGLLAGVAVWPSAASAQLQIATIAGAVTGLQQRPVAGATVVLADPQGAEIHRATADAGGRFALSDVAPGSYQLVVRTGDGVVLTRALVVRGSLPVELLLETHPAVRENVVVNDDAGDATAVRPWSMSGDVVRTTFSALPSQRIQGALGSLPGWTSEDNGLLHLRGVDDGLLYVLDGIPVYERLDRLFGLAPTPASIVSINAISGYIPPEFGYKAGGVVQLRSVSGLGRSWSTTIDAGVADSSTRNAEGVISGPIGPSIGLMLHGSDERSSRFLDPVDLGNLHNQGRSTSWGGQATLRSGLSLFTASMQGGRSRFDVPHDAKQEAEGQDSRQWTQQWLFSASWQRTVSERTVWQLSVYNRRATAALMPSPFDTPVSAGGERRNVRSGGLWSLTHERGRHVLKAGIEVSRLRLNEDFMFAVTEDDEADELGLSAEALEHDRDNPFRVTDSAEPSLVSVFAQDTYRASDRLTVDYGLRIDRSRLLLARSQVSPRIGIGFRAGARTILRGALLRLFQPPQAEYLLLASSPEARRLSPFVTDEIEGGADILPERQTAVEGSVTHELSRRLRLDATSWLRRGQDVDDPNVFLGTTVTFPNSIARQHAHGVDLRLDLLPTRGASASATYTYTRVAQFGPINGGLFLEDEFIEIGEGTEFTPDHDLRHALTVAASYGPQAGRWRMSGSVRYRTGTPLEVDDDDLGELRERARADTVDFDAGRVRPRLVSDLQAQWDLHRDANRSTTLTIWIENVTNRTYAYNFGNPFSGTHFGSPRRFGVAMKAGF